MTDIILNILILAALGALMLVFFNLACTFLGLIGFAIFALTSWIWEKVRGS